MPWKQKLLRRALPAALDTISHVVPERAQPGSIKAFVALPPGRVSTATGLTPLVGREAELCLLLERWEHAKAGEGQVVLLAGEAGIGKSRLMETLRQRVAAEPHIRLGSGKNRGTLVGGGAVPTQRRTAAACSMRHAECGVDPRVLFPAGPGYLPNASRPNPGSCGLPRASPACCSTGASVWKPARC